MGLRKWSPKEEALLRDIYPNSTKKSLLAAFPNRNSYSAIRSRATLLGLKKAIGNGGRKIWEPDELEELKQLYSDTENSVLIAKFKCSLKGLYSAAHALELKKSEQHISKICGAVLKKVGVSTRFAKGTPAHNKGKKWNEFMSEESQKRISETQFKKGNKPHNTVEVGFERITKDGYLEVKVGDFDDSTKNFQLKHRLVWESVNGPIPENYQVRFIDGDKTNFEITNLRLVSYSESLIANSMKDTSIVKRFLGIKDENQVDNIIKNNPDLISLKRNQIILNKQINKNGKNAPGA